MVKSPDGSRASPHTPVLLQEVLSALDPKSGSRIIDGTVGAAGHAYGILVASSPDGELLGLDRDQTALAIARERLTDFGFRALLRQGSFSEILDQAAGIGWKSVQGVLLDLGVSSMQLADPDRGFSFREDGPLDMRFDLTQELRAADLVNGLQLEELTSVIRLYGEEPKAYKIAKAIVQARPLTSTRQLADVIARVSGHQARRIHPATRTFQALRIAVNDELDTLQEGLTQAIQVLEPGGRLAVISFHSLEDRIVKRTFRRESQNCVCPPDQPVCTCDGRQSLKILTRRPIQPTEGEVMENPRARSARLRVAEKVAMA
ncbi:MAG: 16S rRNA (cytosine(1402)-N(4))-methyltransferase [Chloroflexi bacterium RBG_16_48_8]|nr:MAG: 16S rRNA (cytosine(1402)-N(4))-methyltransferase [Chloroflexi bacterium RBG_16_48_8]